MKFQEEIPIFARRIRFFKQYDPCDAERFSIDKILNDTKLGSKIQFSDRARVMSSRFWSHTSIVYRRIGNIANYITRLEKSVEKTKLTNDPVRLCQLKYLEDTGTL